MSLLRRDVTSFSGAKLLSCYRSPVEAKSFSKCYTHTHTRALNATLN